MKSKIDIRAFQKRYGLANREMAEVIGCSLPTIQKWRSGEIAISPAASQLLRVLDHSAGGDPVALRDILQSSQTDVDWETANTAAPESEVRRLENSVSEVVDRLELMLDNRRKAKELAQSEVRYRTMMESYAEPICRWLPDTTLTYVNAAYRDLFSQFGDDLIGRKWIEFVPKEKRPQIHMLVADIVRRGEVETVFHESIDREGVIKYQEWKDIPIKNEHGEVVELHSIGRDLTERFHLKRELAAHRRSLEAALDWEGHGLVIFDKKGQFLETNTRFRDEMLAGKVATSFAEWVPRFQSLKFKRLLKRLNSEGELTFRVSVEGQTFLLNLRLLDRSEASTRYLALVKRGIGSGTLDRLMGVRFASESLIDASEGGFHIPKQSQNGIREVMSREGFERGVDRCYVFTFDDPAGVFDNVIEWCGEGVEPVIEGLRRIPLDTYPWWIGRIRAGHWIMQEDITQLPRAAHQERAVLEAQDIRAILVAPIEQEGVSVGFVGFDFNRGHRLWHAQDKAALGRVKERVESALSKLAVSEQLN